VNAFFISFFFIAFLKACRAELLPAAGNFHAAEAATLPPIFLRIVS
jgi:hypothetical protein